MAPAHARLGEGGEHGRGLRGGTSCACHDSNIYLDRVSAQDPPARRGTSDSGGLPQPGRSQAAAKSRPGSPTAGDYADAAYAEPTTSVPPLSPSFAAAGSRNEMTSKDHGGDCST
ncbi:hypothetical protein Pmi06nite_15550 [Planotetraspora mira]|uniref:Uncharacterized protein n=1 Tax=Planotetraspora mira TaxID=58121 RepID=A0A8J3X919_9ACTN|nr:hypothetical protein Pmi06nite_15550 [Planotetraspora mira]